MKKKRIAVLFDMDGVLVDNHEFHYKAWMKFGEKYNVPITRERFLSFFGSSAREAIKNIFEKDMPFEQVRKYASEKEDIYREIYKPHLKLIKGVKEFLNLLKQENIPTAVATSAPLVNAEFVLNEGKIADLFDTIVHDAHFKHGKPDPEVYLKAAEKLNFDTSECIVFEDSHQGIEAARNANMKVIGVATTNPPELLQHTDKVINDFTEIKLEDIYKIMNH